MADGEAGIALGGEKGQIDFDKVHERAGSDGDWRCT